MDRQTFRRPILPTDWNRFEINAMRVRRFGHPDSSAIAYAIGINVYAALACASVGKTPLLPHLTDVCWSKWTEYSYIHLFVSPSIQKCTFNVTSSLDTSIPLLQLSLLPPLVSACPHVTRLTLNGLSRSPWQEIDKGLSTLRRWSSLRFLELWNLPDASMLCVAKFPFLRELIIKSPRETGEEHLPMHIKGFTKLEYIDIANSSIELPVELISCMSRTPLQTLRLEFGRDPVAGELSNLFMSMRRNISQFSLRNLRLDYDLEKADLVEGERSISITLEELSPLLTFTNLLDVSIELNYEFHLDKEDLRIITSSWPHLQHLKLASLRPSQYWPLISINDFTYFVGQCPSLEGLTIAFDASEACLGTEKPGGGVCYEKIHTLGVLHSPIGDPGNVAAFLSDIFPNLRDIPVFYSEDLELPDDYYELDQKWGEVLRLVKLFSLVRTQEKMFRE